MTSSLLSTLLVAKIILCIKMSHSYADNVNPQADLTFRITPDNYVLRVPASEAVGQFIALSTQGTVTRSRTSVGENSSKSTASSDVVRQTVPYELDIRYGDREQQLLDIYGTDLPPGDIYARFMTMGEVDGAMTVKCSPIFVYLHGGVWSAREVTKDNSAYPVLPLWGAGVKVVVGEYDLAPNVTLDIIVEEIRELAMFVLQMAETENCRNVWFGGHSAGGHLVSELLQAKWYNSLNLELKGRFQGVVLISGLFDLTPFLSLEINSVLQLTRKSAVALSPALSKGSILRVPQPMTVFLVSAQQDAPVYLNQTAQYYQVIKKQPGINATFLKIPGLDIDHYSNVIYLQYPDYLLTKNIIILITRSFI